MRLLNCNIESSRLIIWMVSMKTVGLFEAKQKLSELVERAREGEHIGNHPPRETRRSDRPCKAAKNSCRRFGPIWNKIRKQVDRSKFRASLIRS